MTPPNTRSTDGVKAPEASSVSSEGVWAEQGGDAGTGDQGQAGKGTSGETRQSLDLM